MARPPVPPKRSFAASIGSTGVQPLEEEPAGLRGVLCHPRGLELASDAEEKCGHIRPTAKVDLPEGAIFAFPERTRRAGARLDLTQAFLHPADRCFHDASLKAKVITHIGACAELSQ